MCYERIYKCIEHCNVLNCALIIVLPNCATTQTGILRLKAKRRGAMLTSLVIITVY